MRQRPPGELVPEWRAMMRTACWVLVILGSVIGGFLFVSGLAGAQRAPQQAAAVGMGLAFAVLRYCLARAVEALAVTPSASVMGLVFLGAVAGCAGYNMQ